MVKYSQYSAPEKGWQIILNRNQAGPGRRVKQRQKQTSLNHVQALFWSSVYDTVTMLVTKSDKRLTLKYNRQRILRWTKRLVWFAKQDPGRARQNS